MNNPHIFQKGNVQSLVIAFTSISKSLSLPVGLFRSFFLLSPSQENELFSLRKSYTVQTDFIRTLLFGDFSHW